MKKRHLVFFTLFNKQPLRINFTSIFFLLFFLLAKTGLAYSTFTSKDNNENKMSKGNSNGMSFIENKGQVVDVSGHLRPDILYTGDGGGNKVYLRKTGVSYVLSNMGEIVQEVEKKVEELRNQGTINKQEEQKTKDSLLQKQTLKQHRVDFDFVNANTNAAIETHDKQEGYNNYYYGHCPQGITHVNSYNQVIQKNIYNKIDVMYYGGKAQGLKYDIVVNPCGNPNDIQLKYSGADNLKSEGGRLQIETSLGKMIEYMPKVYQEIEGKIVDVEAKYEIADLGYEKEKKTSQYPIFNTQIKFKLGTYNLHYPLIIDPWATYYGGSAIAAEASTGIATDNAGNVYITGNTASADFPVLGGSQMACMGLDDAFVVKFNPVGTLSWATYYGGSNVDYGKGIAMDNAGNVLITGYTQSTDFPVLAGFQMVNGGGFDAFIVKFNFGGTLTWASYYGGSDGDGGLDITRDNASNDIYITGFTTSPNFPVLSGFQMTNGSGGGYSDAFVMKLNPAGNPTWATYYGGSDDEQGTAIATDVLGNVVITGSTVSSDLPVSGGFQMLSAGGTLWGNDAFVAKFNSIGALAWATYYGGSSEDFGIGIATDIPGNVIITGHTYSADFPVSAGAFQAALGGGFDAFVVKLDPAGACTWATYYGSIGANCWGLDIVPDGNNNIYLYMEAEDKPTPSLVDLCSYQPVFNGGATTGPPEDQLIVKFSPAGQKICATYMGGTGEDDLEPGDGGIAVYGNSLYITGITNGGYPVTAGTAQTVYGGGPWDVFVASLCINICEGKVLGLDFTSDTNTTCANSTINYTAAISNACDTSGFQFQWTFTGGSPPSSVAANPTVTYTSPGNHTAKLVVTTPCKKDSVTKVDYITVQPLPTVTVSSYPITCTESSAIASATGGTGPYSYQWSNTNTGVQVSNLLAGIYTITVTDTHGCITTATLNVTAPPPLIASLSPLAGICIGQNATLSVFVQGGTPNYNYQWNTGQNTHSIIHQPSITTMYVITVTDNNNCTVSATITGTINPLPTVTFSADDTAGCVPLCVTFSNITPGTNSLTWNFGDTSPLSSSSPALHCYTDSGSYSVSLIITDINNCSNTLTKNNYINVYPYPVAAFIATPQVTTLLEPLIRFTDQSQNATIWNWTFGDQLNSYSSKQNPSYTYADTGNYEIILIVTNNYGCSDTTSQNIKILPDISFYAPNSFTPNGDKLNDHFMPKTMGMDPDRFQLWIFDRWGNLIYETHDINKGWDGHANGGRDIAQIDTYVWKVIVWDERRFKHSFMGPVNLIK